MSGLLETKLADITDEDILALIRELEQACPVGSCDFGNLPLLHFLTQCVYPEGPSKRILITTKFAPSAPLLETRVGQLPDGSLRNLCGELALLSQVALELFNGHKVYVLLNKTLPNFAAPKPSETQRRWETVVQQRRSNRG